jgi:hypothetical protein
LKNRSRVILLTVVCLMLGFSNCYAASPPEGQTSTLSGSFQSVFVDSADFIGPVAVSNKLGNGTYTISYDYPSTADVGSNFTAHVSLVVNDLTGLQMLTYQYEITVQVGLSNGNGMLQLVSGTAPLYPGAVWGPKNVTIPVTEANTGLSKGQQENATVTIRLGITTYIGYPFNQPRIQTMIPTAKLVGNLTVNDQVVTSQTSNGGNSGSGVNLAAFLPYLTLGAGAFLVCLGVFFPRIFPERQRP